MNVPVPTNTPSLASGGLELLTELFQSNVFRFGETQGITDVPHVVHTEQFWYASGQHHCKQVDNEVSLLSDYHEGLLAQPFESVTITEYQDRCVCVAYLLSVLIISFTLLSRYDVNEVVRQHKRHSLSLHSKLALEISQEMTKVNMDQLQRRVNQWSHNTHTHTHTPVHSPLT